MPIRLWAVIAIFLGSLAAAAPVIAADDAETTVRAVVQDQIDAFADGDANRAFSHASPKIRGVFQTPDAFMTMVERGYSALIKPKSFAINDVLLDGDKAAVRADLIARDGTPYEAIYPLERQPDGAWRIDGCFLEPAGGQSL